MRGTASHDVVFDSVFIPEEKITARREPSAFAPVLAIIGAKALPVIAATYLGVAARARDAVVERLHDSARAEDPGVRRTVGLIDQRLLSGRATLSSVLRELGDDPEPTPETLRMGSLAKRVVIEDARAVGDLAMDVAGGRAYRHGDEIEQAWRDLRAGPYHPLDHELTLRYAGDLALGRPRLGGESAVRVAAPIDSVVERASPPAPGPTGPSVSSRGRGGAGRHGAQEGV
jgi:acyl-CoA dehydrogenase